VSTTSLLAILSLTFAPFQPFLSYRNNLELEELVAMSMGALIVRSTICQLQSGGISWPESIIRRHPDTTALSNATNP